jgi:WD40 repeat protein
MERIQLELGRTKDPFKTNYLHRKITFSQDGRYMAETGRQENEEAFVWELPEGRLVSRPEFWGNSFLKFIGESYLLMSDGARIWDVATGKAKETAGEFKPETGTRWLLDCYFDQCMALNPDGTLLVGAPLHDPHYYYYRLGLWSLQSGMLLKRFDTPRLKYNNAKIRFSSDGAYFVLAAQVEPEDTNLLVASWEVESGQKLGQWSLEIGIDDFAFEFSPDGSILAVNHLVYELGQNGAPNQSPVSFKPDDTALTAHSRLTLSNRQIMMAIQPGELAVYDLSGQRKLTLDAVYQRKNPVAGGPEVAIERLMPRVMGASHDGRYYAAGDDYVTLVWIV